MGTLYTLTYNPYSQYAGTYESSKPPSGNIGLAYNFNVNSGIDALAKNVNYPSSAFRHNFITSLVNETTRFAVLITSNYHGLYADKPIFDVSTYDITYYTSKADRDVISDGLYGWRSTAGTNIASDLDYFTSYEDMIAAFYSSGSYPIVYRNTNCASSGPTEASVGDVVQVSYSFPDGYGIVNPSTDIYVTNNGVVVPSSYVNGTLTFTMPDPS